MDKTAGHKRRLIQQQREQRQREKKARRQFERRNARKRKVRAKLERFDNCQRCNAVGQPRFIFKGTVLCSDCLAEVKARAEARS